MESTSCKENCPFTKQGFCSSYKECPNHVETWWLSAGNEQPVKLEDCSPKRMLLQQQFLQTRLEFVQQALEQSRNQYNELCLYLKSLVEMSKTVIEHHKPKIEDKLHEKIILELPDNGHRKLDNG